MSFFIVLQVVLQHKRKAITQCTPKEQTTLCVFNSFLNTNRYFFLYFYRMIIINVNRSLFFVKLRPFAWSRWVLYHRFNTEVFAISCFGWHWPPLSPPTQTPFHSHCNIVDIKRSHSCLLTLHHFIGFLQMSGFNETLRWVFNGVML